MAATIRKIVAATLSSSRPSLAAFIHLFRVYNPGMIQAQLLLLSLTACTLMAQDRPAPKSDGPTEKTILRMVQDIRRGIFTLPNYGVFDWVTFSFNGYNVILKGYASRPTLKDAAERVVKNVEGVAAVDNRIEVLPLSPNDDRIRVLAYVRIYGHPQLVRYNPNRGAPIFVSPLRFAIGITNDPPVGFHPIHIIVKNGNIVLEGVVLNEGDRAIAGIVANQIPESFAVENELRVEMNDEKKLTKKKK